MNRKRDLTRLYDLLAELHERLGGARYLRDANAIARSPTRGVYFFYEAGEVRTGSGAGPRVVRVGTHALKPGSKTTLRDRLSQHRGVLRSGGGNHRGSIFRLLVGDALARRDGFRVPSWSVGSSRSNAVAQLGISSDEIRAHEAPLELQVSRVIGAMPFVWVAVEDAPGEDSLRGVIERNAIALLSRWGKPVVDEPSRAWLGSHSSRDRVRTSGLWNNNHVDEAYDPSFLDVLADAVARTERRR